MKLFSDVSNMTLEQLATKLTYFAEQAKLNHLQTSVYAEHVAMGDLYDYLQSFKDDAIEKIMGYASVKIKAYPFTPLVNNFNSTSLCADIMKFASDLEDWASKNYYCDIENMSQELSGKAAKIKYLLTLS